MGAVSTLRDFKNCWDAPTLVLVDLHNDHPPEAESDSDPKDFLDALDKCRTALDYARSHDIPVAFVRHVSPPPSFLATRAYPSWIGDIRPRCSDMVFERASPSCYGSSEFAEMAQRSRELALVGLFGETSCLSTLMEGHGRNHVFTYLADASVSRGRGEISSDEMHRAVSGIASLYCEVSSTEAWVARLSQEIAMTG